MKCLIIDAVHSSIAEEFSKYMQVDTHMLPTQEELAKLIPDYDAVSYTHLTLPTTSRV